MLYMNCYEINHCQTCNFLYLINLTRFALVSSSTMQTGPSPLIQNACVMPGA